MSPGTVADAQGRPVVAPPIRMVPIGGVSSSRMPGDRGLVPAGQERNALDVIADGDAHSGRWPEGDGGPRTLTSVEAHPSLGPPPFQGDKDIDALTREEEDWLVRAALAVIGPIRWVDQVTGTAALAQSTGADLSLTGTNMPGAVIEVIETLLNGDKRRFLFEMYGQRIGRIWRNRNGNLMISFTGNKLLRRFATSNVYGAAKAKVSLIETAAQTRMNPASAVRAVGSRARLVSIAFVTFFDVAEWLTTPAGERDLDDLLATLLWDIAAVTVSIIAGALGAALVLAAAPAVATGAVLVAVGIGVGVVVGLALDWIDSRLGIKAGIREAMDNATINDLDPVFYQQR